MKIESKIKKFQQGGAMPQDPAAQGGAPQEGSGAHGHGGHEDGE